MFVSDASSSNEAVHLQQRLRSLSTELVSLRNRLHVQGAQTNVLKGGTPSATAAAATPQGATTATIASIPTAATIQPAIPPRSVLNVPLPLVSFQ